MDFEEDLNSFGGLRITFCFDSFIKMVKSLEVFLEKNIHEWNPIVELPLSDSKPDWYSLRNDLYNGNIQTLNEYTKMYIGDIYWNSLFMHRISPDSSISDIKKLLVD